MIWIRSLIFFFYYPLCTAGVSLILFPSLMLSKDRHTTKPGEIWAKALMFGLKYICNVTYEIRGTENLPAAPCIVAAKHQSAWDTAIMFLILNQPCYVLKKELTKIPFFGTYLKRMGMIAIDRSAQASALKHLVRATEERLSEGYQVVVFPEGTRTQPGKSRPYQPGIAALYTNKQITAPIIPTALNSGHFWTKNRLLVRPGTIILEFLPAIEPGKRRNQFMDELEETIERHSNALILEAK